MKIKKNLLIIGLLFLSMILIVGATTRITDTYISISGVGNITKTATCIVSQDGSGDYTNIQSCLTQLSSSGGQVFVRNGTYTITSAPLNISGNTELICSGWGTKIKLGNNVNRSIIRNKNYEIGSGDINIKIKDCFLEGNSENNLGSNFSAYHTSAIDFNSVSFFVLENIYINNTRGGGIYVINPTTMPSRSYSNSIISNVIVNQTKLDVDSAYGHGIYLTAGYNFGILMDNIITANNQANGIMLEDFVGRVSLSNCLSENNTQNGVYWATVNNVIVSNCQIFNNRARGILVSQASNYSTVSNNIIWENGYEGIYFNDNANIPSFASITGNVVYNNGDVTDSAGINLLTDNNTVVGNVAFDDQGTKTQTYGLTLGANSDGNIIVGNKFSGNKNGDYSSTLDNPDIWYNNINANSKNLTGATWLNSTNIGATNGYFSTGIQTDLWSSTGNPVIATSGGYLALCKSGTQQYFQIKNSDCSKSMTLNRDNSQAIITVSDGDILSIAAGIKLTTTRPTATESNCYWNNTANYHCLQCYNSTHWVCGTDRI